MLSMISAGIAVTLGEEITVNRLLAVSRLIDALNEGVGRLTYWLVLVAVLVSAGNAIIRYTFNMSSNAWLEIQWYLFSAVFLFCAGYALLHNQHVRIDVITGRLSKRAQAWIDIFGTRVLPAADGARRSCGCRGRCSSTPINTMRFRPMPAD